MSDIVERLRESVRACRAIDRSEMLEEAATEIERLRATLTDAEREAVERAIKTLDGWQQTGGYHSALEDDAAALRGLLERIGGGE